MKAFTEDIDKNIRSFSLDDWKKVFSSSLAFKYTTKPYTLNPSYLYRGRSNYDSKGKPIDFFNNTSDLWAPPADCVGKPGRCNIAGQSTLYCATSVTTTLFEVRPNTGEELTIVEYEVTKDLTSLAIVGCREIMALGEAWKNIFGNHFNDTSKEAEQLDDILSKLYRMYHSAEFPIYNITNALYQMFIDVPEVTVIPAFLQASKFNGLIYPSLATNKLLGINIALDPESAKSVLKPISACKYHILKKVDENRYEIILTHRTVNVTEEGKLEWVKNENAEIERITDL